MADGSRSFNFPAPQRSRLRPGEIVVDLFAGGGGASEGLKQAKHTARVFLSECRVRRHGHGFWFVFNAAQRARMRASAPAALSAPPAQPDLFA